MPSIPTTIKRLSKAKRELRSYKGIGTSNPSQVETPGAQDSMCSFPRRTCSVTTGEASLLSACQCQEWTPEGLPSLDTTHWF